MEWKLFDEPHSCSREWYADLPVADHINQKDHSLRLYVAAAYAAWLVRFAGVETVGDFGCGNGGLLASLNRLLDVPVRMWGYDILPANVRDAQQNGLAVKLCDFLTESVEWPDLLVMTEVLEHLVDPSAFLKRVPSGTYLLATVPALENDARHYEHHLWAWDRQGLLWLLEGCGYEVRELTRFERRLLAVGKKTC